MEPADLSDIVDVQVEVAQAVVAARGLGVIMLVTEHEVHETRVITYKGKPEKILADILAAGHLPSSILYRAAKTIVAQKVAPNEIRAGLKLPAESWTEALTAVRAANRAWYCLFTEARSLEDVLECAVWQSARKWGIYSTTPSAAVSADIAADVDDNLLAQIQALGLARVILTPHDPATTSGAAVPSVMSKVGTFALDNGDALTVAMDYGADVVITWAAAAAIKTASNPGTYNLTVGDAFAFSVNGGATSTLTIAADTFPDVDAVTAAQFAAWVQAAVSVSLLVASAPGGGSGPRFTTVRKGTGAQFSIKNTSTPDLLTALGLTVSDTDGTGDAVNIAATTATEAVAKISAALGGDAVVTVTDLAIKIAGTVPGDEGAVHVKGGSANNAFKFKRSRVIGKGTRDDFFDAGWLARCITPNLETPRPRGGSITWDDVIVLNCYADDYEDERASLHERFANTYELRSSDQLPGETHFGTCTDGRFIDAITTSDLATLRLAEDFKRVLNQAAQRNVPIDFTDDDAGATAYNVCQSRLRRLDAAGHLVADLTPPTPPSKPTGLTIPLRADISEDDKQQRLWGPIEFIAQLKGKVHKWRVRGTLIF